ncbi:MAG: DUF1559 domain-containing protein [Thermoguttaceae bacterium]|nr:DUF1559 domain-containing protein [Thermoguttaceae bacterium]
MKRLIFALGAFALLWASALFAAQPEFLDVAPFLTKETFYLSCVNVEEVSLPEILTKAKETGEVVFPNLTAEPVVQGLLSQADAFTKALQVRRDAVVKLSGGYVYVASGTDGTCWIVPIKNADAEAEKTVLDLLNDFPFVELKDENLKEIAAQIREKVTVRRTPSAIVFFVPLAGTGGTEASAENLDEYLKGAAERPDFAEGFQKARFGKVSTVLWGFPLTTRDEIAKRGFGFADDSPFTKEEFYEIVDSARCVVLSSDSFWGVGTAQVVFDSEKTAKATLSVLDKYSGWLREKLTRDAENAEVVNDLISWLFPAVMPEQKGAVLTLEPKAALEKAAAPVNALFGELARFQASQREKFRVDAKEEADRQYKELKKWITPNTALIVRLDLEKVTPDQWFMALENAAKTLLPETMKSENVRTALGLTVPGRRITETVLSAMKAHGAKEIYAILDYSNFEFLVQIRLPGVTLKEGTGNDGFLTAADLFGNAGEMKPLAGAIDQNFVMGQRYESVVLLPKIGRAASMESGRIWKDFVFSQAPGNDFPGSRTSALMSGKDLSYFRDALELNAQCGISAVLQMNPIFAEVAQQGIREARENLDVKLAIPSKQFIEDGLNLVALGADPNLGLFRFNILAKSKKSAGKMVKLFELWKQQIEEELKEGAPEDISPTYAAFGLDFTDFFLSFLVPVREGNRLYWDISQNERLNKLRENVPAPVLKVGGAGVLVGLLVPAVQKARWAARTNQTMNNYKEIGLAMLNHEATFRALPTAYTVDEDGKPLHSWRVLILPFLGEHELYLKIRLDEPWDSEWNRQFHDQCPKVYQSVFNPSKTDAVVGVVVGNGTMFPPVTEKGQKGVGLEKVTDGLSNTIMVVPCKPVCWMDPTGDPKVSDLQSPEDVVYDGTKETFPVTMGDCSVQQISVTIDPVNWINLLLRNDGKAVLIE